MRRTNLCLLPLQTQLLRFLHQLICKEKMKAVSIEGALSEQETNCLAWACFIGLVLARCEAENCAVAFSLCHTTLMIIERHDFCCASSTFLPRVSVGQHPPILDGKWPCLSALPFKSQPGSMIPGAQEEELAGRYQVPTDGELLDMARVKSTI